MASGVGRRFGGNKLLAITEGTPLFVRALDALPAALFQRAVLCSPYPEILSLAEARGYLPLPNPHGAEGISASVRLGLAQMEDMDGVLFAVCDQPQLKTESIHRLLSSFKAQPDRIHALGWQGQRGNPVVFPRHDFHALSALTGDRGGGAVLQQNLQRLTLVEATSPDELRDVDRPEDLAPIQ